MQVQSLGQEDPLEEEMVTHSSILAWRIPWTEKLCRLQSMRWQRLRQDWSSLAHMHPLTWSLLLCKDLRRLCYHAAQMTLETQRKWLPSLGELGTPEIPPSRIHDSWPVYVCKLKITSSCISLTDDLANHQNETPPNAQSFRGAPRHLRCVESVPFRGAPRHLRCVESVPRLWYVWFHEQQQMTCLVECGMEWKRQRSLRKRHVDRHRGRDTICKTLCFACERAYEPLFKPTPR